MAKGRGDDSEDDDLDEELFQLTEKKSNKRNKSIESSDEDYEEKSNKKKKTGGPGRKKGSTVQSSSSASTINYGGGNRRNRGSTITENYGDFDDGLDSELYKDDQDRYELSLLPEVERENILSERYEKRKEARERWTSAKEKEKENKQSNASSSSTSNSSSKSATSSTRGRSEREDKQKEALKDIAKKREKSLANKKDKDDEESSSITNTPTTQSANSTPKTQSSSKMDQQYRHDKEREKEKELRDIENKIQDRIAIGVETININLMNQCRLSRNMLVKWMDQPYFETLAPNFFVRVVIGQHLNNPIYRIAEIVEVCTGHKLYKVENKETDKLLKLSYAGSKKEFGIENVSNNIITTTEHEKWISDMIRAGKTLPNPEDIENKIADIKKAQDYIYTDEDIEKRAQDRIKYQKVPVNIAIEKAKLVALRETFEPNSDEYKNICERINELNKATATQKVENTTKVDQLISTINKKNKSLNFKYQQSAGSSTEQVSNEFDPFARRKTRNCAVVAVESNNITNTTATTTTASPINASLSPSSQHFEKQSKQSTPQPPSKQINGIDNVSNRSLYDIHKSIDLNIFIPDQPKEVLLIQPKKKRQIIPANIIKNDHSMFKNILSFDEYLTKRNSMVQ